MIVLKQSLVKGLKYLMTHSKYISLSLRIGYNSKFITIPIDKIDAVSYPTNIRC